MSFKDDIILIKQRRDRSPLYNKIKGVPPYVWFFLLFFIIGATWITVDANKNKEVEDKNMAITELSGEYSDLVRATNLLFLNNKAPYLDSTRDFKKEYEELTIKKGKLDKIHEQMVKEQQIKEYTLQDAAQAELDEGNKEVSKAPSKTDSVFMEIANNKREADLNIRTLERSVGVYTEVVGMFEEVKPRQKTRPILYDSNLVDVTDMKLKNSIKVEDYDKLRKKYYTENTKEVAYKDFAEDTNKMLDVAKQQLQATINAQNWVDKNYPGEIVSTKATQELYDEFDGYIKGILNPEDKKKFKKILDKYKEEVAKQIKQDELEEERNKEEEKESKRKAEEAAKELEALNAEKERVRIETDAAKHEAEQARIRAESYNNGASNNNNTVYNQESSTPPPTNNNNNNNSNSNSNNNNSNNGNNTTDSSTVTPEEPSTNPTN